MCRGVAGFVGMSGPSPRIPGVKRVLIKSISKSYRVQVPGELGAKILTWRDVCAERGVARLTNGMGRSGGSAS